MAAGAAAWGIEMASDEPLLIQDIAAAGGRTIKRVTLNAPKALNSLSLAMARELQPKLIEWDADNSVVAIFIEGAGDRAFCAGGDIVQIYHGMKALHGEGEGDADYPDNFFEAEYRLDYTLHSLTTPVIGWGNGVAMGGGLGILAGCHFRVVTENARLAMPEITIGLFPDVGGTWFLNRMPGRSGLFLGLTGAHMNAGDALFVGLADRYLPHAAKDDVLSVLASAEDWGDPAHTVDRLLRRLAHEQDRTPPASNVRRHLDRINDVTDADTLSELVGAIRGLASADDKWLAKAAATLDGGCPVTAHLVHEQIRHGSQLSLRDVFLRELAMARQCIRHPDFREGVRALLIDKDGQPDWSFKSVAEVPASTVKAHFAPSWDGDHPLADLTAPPAVAFR